MGRSKPKIFMRRVRLADGNHAVASIEGVDGGYCRRPCPQCPWRSDIPAGAFPAEAFRISAETAYDAAFTAFACHMAGSDNPKDCAGFLISNADNNIAVRLKIISGRYDPRSVSSPFPLYPSYRAMAEANGVDPSDPVLQPCRGNNDDFRR